ncbi:MAG: MMPL family transporter, partial [Spirochaetes bacterium]|nr:MMPL family transporter [Spirochaetota bacterium]
KIDNDVKSFLDTENPHRAFFEKTNQIFGNSDIIFIGIETDNIYSQQVVNFLKTITEKVESLNQTMPLNNIAKYLDLNRDSAVKVIQALNEKELSGKEEIWNIFTNPDILSQEFFWDAEFSKKVAGKVKDGTIDELLSFYSLPINKVLSFVNIPFIKGEKNSIIIEKLYPDNASPDEALKILRERTESWPLYKGALVSYDSTMTTAMITLNVTDLAVREEADKHISEIVNNATPPGVKIYMSGLSIIVDKMTEYMYKDLYTLLPLVTIIIILALVICFRHIEGVIIPLLAIGLSILWTFGILAIIDLPLNLISINIPVLMVAVASAYGIHILNHYYLHPGTDRREVLTETIFNVGKPVIIAGLTTVAGFGSLLTAELMQIRNFGIAASIGVFFSLVISMLLIPAILMMRKGPKPAVIFTRSDDKKRDITQWILDLSYTIIDEHPKKVVIVFILLIISCIYGATKAEINISDIGVFKKTSEIWIADEVLNRKLAGTQMLDVVFETNDNAPIIQPAILKKINDLESDIKKKFPEVRKTISFNDYIMKINQEMHGGDIRFHAIPDDSGQINDFLLFMSGNLKDYITNNKDKLRLTITIKRVATKKLAVIYDYINNYFNKDFLAANNMKATITGGTDFLLEGNKLLMEAQVNSMLSSMVVNILLIFSIFLSVKLTIIGLIPLLFGILANFGIMGFIGIPLNAATVMVTAIVIGIGIDYSVHFISHFKRISESYEFSEALALTFMETGRAIIFNFATVAAGFIVMVLSQYVLIQQFSLLITIAMIITGFGALIFIPVALKLAHGEMGPAVQNK